MNAVAIAEWAIFLALAAVALGGAAMMLLTMSMYRAGLFLMVSFLALAGLFFLLEAELLAVIQVMMNAGAMLVMIVFMVMLMIDPGGEMMWDMKRQMRLPGLGAFSMSMPRRVPPMPDAVGAVQHADKPSAATAPTDPVRYTCPMHPEVVANESGACPKCGMNLVPMGAGLPGPRAAPTPAITVGTVGGNTGGHAHGEAAPSSTAPAMSPVAHHKMMVDMAMSTEQLPWALAIGLLSAVGLTVLAVVTPWPLAPRTRVAEASTAVGELLLTRYMMVFEGAAMLILAGIAGGVILGRREQRMSTAVDSDGAALEEQARRTTQPNNGETIMHETRDVKAPQGATEIWTCPMHREVREAGPGKCPKCGMNLVPESSLGGSSEAGSGSTGSSG